MHERRTNESATPVAKATKTNATLASEPEVGAASHKTDVN